MLNRNLLEHAAVDRGPIESGPYNAVSFLGWVVAILWCALCGCGAETSSRPADEPTALASDPLLSWEGPPLFVQLKWDSLSELPLVDLLAKDMPCAVELARGSWRRRAKGRCRLVSEKIPRKVAFNASPGCTGVPDFYLHIIETSEDKHYEERSRELLRRSLLLHRLLRQLGTPIPRALPVELALEAEGVRRESHLPHRSISSQAILVEDAWTMVRRLGTPIPHQEGTPTPLNHVQWMRTLAHAALLSDYDHTAFASSLAEKNVIWFFPPGSKEGAGAALAIFDIDHARYMWADSPEWVEVDAFQRMKHFRFFAENYFADTPPSSAVQLHAMQVFERLVGPLLKHCHIFEGHPLTSCLAQWEEAKRTLRADVHHVFAFLQDYNHSLAGDAQPHFWISYDEQLILEAFIDSFGRMLDEPQRDVYIVKEHAPLFLEPTGLALEGLAAGSFVLQMGEPVDGKLPVLHLRDFQQVWVDQSVLSPALAL